MILLFLSIFISFAIGWLLIRCLLSESSVPRYLCVLMALPVGWALTSIFFFLWLVVSDGKSLWYPAVEIVLFLAVLVYALNKLRKGRKTFSVRTGLRKKEAWVSIGFFIFTIMNFSIVAMKTSLNPWGRWDAWARINLKARFLFGGGDNWTWIFESSHIAHHDYPLLLGSSVARTWAWMGEISHLGPQVISIVWGLLSILLLFFFVLWLRGPVFAMIVGLSYLTFFPLLYWSAGQYSDLPLVVYMISAMALLIASKGDREHGEIVFLAGLFVGAAAWSKNEGILFLACALVWSFFLAFKHAKPSPWKFAASFFSGLSFPLIALLVLKVVFAGKTDLIEGQMSSLGQIIFLITDLERHQFIWREFQFYLEVLWNRWPLLLLSIGYVLHLAGQRFRIANIGPFGILAALSVAYYYVLITTPYDISWHVSTALDRLLLQLWPIFVFSLAMLFNNFYNQDSEARHVHGEEINKVGQS